MSSSDTDSDTVSIESNVGSFDGEVRDLLGGWYAATSPYFRHLLKRELGSAPHDDVLYHPRALYIFAVRYRMTLYREFIRSMQRAKDILDRSDRGLGLLVREGCREGSDAATELHSPPIRGDNVDDDASPFTERATRLLPDGLKCLGGIMLRTQEGGAENEGFIVPPSIVHYSTFLSQVAEMQADVGGDCAPSEQWACEPSGWAASNPHVDSVRNVLCARDGPLIVPVVEANTCSAEILGLVAAYCTMVASEHAHLDREGLLDTANLPVFPHTPPISTDKTLPSSEVITVKKLPVSKHLPKPFPHLNATSLLPSCGDSNTQVAAEHLANNVSFKNMIRDLFGSAPFVKVPKEGNAWIEEDDREDRLYLYDQLATVVSKFTITEGDDCQLSLITPLEAVFAFDVLLPFISHQHGISQRTTGVNNCRDATKKNPMTPPQQQPSPSTSDTTSTSTATTTSVTITTPIKTYSRSYRVNAPDIDLVDNPTLLNNVSFMFNLHGDIKEMGKEARWLVEPRLGYVHFSVTKEDASLICEYVNPRPYSLSCTVDQFLRNAEKKANMLLLTTGYMGDDVSVTGAERGMYHCHQLPPSTSSDISHFIFPHVSTPEVTYGYIDFKSTTTTSSKTPTNTTTTTTGVTKRNLVGNAPATTSVTEGSIESLVSASLSRTTKVMRVANFLGLIPLVELCGLVTAILLQGRSLEEIRTMFKKCAPAPTTD